MHSLTFLAGALSLTNLAAAIPNAKPTTTSIHKSTSTSTHHTSTKTTSSKHHTPTPHLPELARFDNDENFTPVVAARPVDLYLDLYYNGFVGVVNTNPVVSGILPQSPNNDIAFGPLAVGTLKQGPAQITTVYQDSTVDFFDLHSFYFGCAVGLENGAAAVPTSCTLTATCINNHGKTIATQNFSFTRNGGLTQQMVKATPHGFTSCQTVGFTSNNQAGVTGATVMDTFSYTVFSSLPLSP